MLKLQQFWFRFQPIGEPTALNLGCGVTAFGIEDAMTLIKSRVFKEQKMPKAIEIIENVTFDMLEQRHVAPNLGDRFVRGIWFPQGFYGE